MAQEFVYTFILLQFHNFLDQVGKLYGRGVQIYYISKHQTNYNINDIQENKKVSLNLHEAISFIVYQRL